MMRSTVILVLLLACQLVGAQPYSPGFVDPRPVLDAAAKAIGVDNLKCVTISGTGYSGAVGQQWWSDRNVDWPRGEPLANYTRTMNWDAKTMKEEFDRKPGMNPASWKYGAGWMGGTPPQRQPRQTFIVNGQYGWHVDGPGSAPVAASPDDAERWQLDLWVNPHGFLKAARMPGANPVAVWRWELGEMGRDGPTTVPEKMTVVSIQMGKYRIDATINKENLLQRIHTWVPHPVLGDMNYEHEFTNASYIDIGSGVRFPTGWHHHEGWDDNYNAQNITAGHNGFGGSTHNSVAVEFKDFVAVVEAPVDEARSLAVIEEVAQRMPGKPIRFLVNTHQHFDHIGGLRTYLHIGATIVTHWKNFDFYNRDVLNAVPRTLQPDMVARWPPTELFEGYNIETVRENYVITDGTRIMQMYYVHPLQHAEGMLMAYLPKEKLVIEADMVDTHVPLPGAPTPANKSFYNEVRTLKLDVARIVPIHGAPVAWGDFAKVMGAPSSAGGQQR
jgi:glyoxylase-like metal-dependent hydrolase (beta-lactamase superfamily II)